MFKDRFLEIEKSKPIKRGIEFQNFILDLIGNESIDIFPSFRPRGEEIDGGFFHFGKTFLLETKWVKYKVPASDIFTFDGKVRRKFQGTIGIFWSISGYSDECIEAIRIGKQLNIILFDKIDLEGILTGTFSFLELLIEKLKIAGSKGIIHFNSNDILNNQKLLRKAISGVKNLIILCEGQTDRVIVESLIGYIIESKNLPIPDITFYVSGGKSRLLYLLPNIRNFIEYRKDDLIIAIIDKDMDAKEKTNEIIREILNLIDWKSRVKENEAYV